MPSIKEKEKYNGGELVVMAFIVLVFFFGVLFVIAKDAVDGYQYGDVVMFGILIAMTGLMLSVMFKLVKSCQVYKGAIKILSTRRAGCFKCKKNCSLELYKYIAKVERTRHYRVIYTRIETRTWWGQRVHCMSCGHICSSNEYRDACREWKCANTPKPTVVALLVVDPELLPSPEDSALELIEMQQPLTKPSYVDTLATSEVPMAMAEIV